MMHRYGKKEPSDYVFVTVYCGRVWTGPGQSYWYESFWEPGEYAQVRLIEKSVSVPVWLADLVASAKTFEDRCTVDGGARELGFLEKRRV